MKYSSFAHFVNLGSARYGDDVNIWKGGDDASIIEAYINAKIHSSQNFGLESLDERWVKVREIFETFHFVPFNEKVFIQSCAQDVLSNIHNETRILL